MYYELFFFKDARDTGTKDENCRGAYEKERDLLYSKYILLPHKTHS